MPISRGKLMVNKTIPSGKIGEVLGAEFDSYNVRLINRLNALSKSAAADIVRHTKRTAPARPRGKQDFKKAITSKEVKKSFFGNTYAWCVNAPHYRLTHLLVHGHATRSGGRTRPNSFLADACEQVLPEFQKNAENAVTEVV